MASRILLPFREHNEGDGTDVKDDPCHASGLGVLGLINTLQIGLKFFN